MERCEYTILFRMVMVLHTAVTFPRDRRGIFPTSPTILLENDMMSGSSRVFLYALLALLSSNIYHFGVAQVSTVPDVIALWPESAPGALGAAEEDTPSLTIYLPAADQANGAAVVICPGGGYRHLAVDHEGHEVARWLNSLGVAAFIVQYRLGPKYRHPAPLQDAQRAIRTVRARATEWGVDRSRIGILGFSAGGHLATTAGTHFDAGDSMATDLVERNDSRPDFLIAVYPVISLVSDHRHHGSRVNLVGEDAPAELVALLSNELQVTAATPPTFLVHTSDDASVPVENSLLFYQALRDAGVPAEMHIFETGRHGFGLAPENPVLREWPSLCERWLRARGIMP
jgi:acetyl esterase/lipase